MVAPQPTIRTVNPPPDVPDMPDVSATLTGYLRNFALWCRRGIDDKFSVNTAQPNLMLLAYDATPGTNAAVYQLGVTQAGLATLAPMALGSNTAGTPVPIGVMRTGDTMTGNLTINSPDGDNLNLYSLSPTTQPWSGILSYGGTGGGGWWGGYVNGLERWEIDLGDNALDIWRYDDSGAGVDAPLSINRASGVVDVPNGVSFGNFGYGGNGIQIDWDGAGWGLPFIVNGAYPFGFACIPISLGDATFTPVRMFGINGSLGQMLAWYTPSAAWYFTPDTPSDVRLKKNIQPGEKDALAAINALSIIECDVTHPPAETSRHWNWSFIADDKLEEAIPDALIPATDITHAGVRMLPVIAALTKAVQQLSARVEELEAAR